MKRDQVKMDGGNLYKNRAFFGRLYADDNGEKRRRRGDFESKNGVWDPVGAFSGEHLTKDGGWRTFQRNKEAEQRIGPWHD